MYLNNLPLFSLIAVSSVSLNPEISLRATPTFQRSAYFPVDPRTNLRYFNRQRRSLNFVACIELNMSTSESNNEHTSGPYHSPAQFVIDESGRKWRLCVAAAVLNSDRDKILVGERLGRPEHWQCPQGGVNDADPSANPNSTRETIAEAAARELYEEMGLKVGEHVKALTQESLVPSIRYITKGTGSWMEKEGFVGQELHWIVFQSIDGVLEAAPEKVCNLNGLNGEHAEFTRVKWETTGTVVDEVWEKKKASYEALHAFLQSSKL